MTTSLATAPPAAARPPARFILTPGLAAEIALVGAITLLAAVLRLWDLASVPDFYDDEAQFANDAQRVIHEGWIGPYTISALGQPSGIAYVGAPGQLIFGDGVFGARFGTAVVAILAVPLAYLLFRILAGRTPATISAALLATSLWHLQVSRIALQPVLAPTIGLAVLLCFVLAIRQPRWYWFALGGAFLGLGLYTYNNYPTFVLAFSAWVLLFTLLYRREPGVFLPWTKKLAMAAGISIVVGLPLFSFIARSPDEYFYHYRSYYHQYSILQSPDYKSGDFGQRVEIIGRQVKKFVGAYAWRGVVEGFDTPQPDRPPLFGPLTVVLLILGVCYGIRHWRRPEFLLALVMTVVIPLPGILQTNAYYRGPVAASPFVAFLTAVPLALVWTRTGGLTTTRGRLACGLVVLALAVIAYDNVHDYFTNWAAFGY